MSTVELAQLIVQQLSNTELNIELGFNSVVFVKQPITNQTFSIHIVEDKEN